jgi:hypothetical protein
MDLRPTLTLIHVLAALVFVIAHAVSAVAMFQVRGQLDRVVLTATLNRSSKAQIVAYIALLGFVGSWWGSLWIWVSLVLFVVVGWAMALRPELVLVIGLAGLIAITWLMVTKPF